MPPFPVNLAALVAAEAAVRDRATVRTYVEQTKAIRENFTAELRKLSVRTFPSAGNFLLADFGPQGPALFSTLAAQGILLRDRGKEFAPGYVRITIGSAAEMRRLLKAIRSETAVVIKRSRLVRTK